MKHVDGPCSFCADRIAVLGRKQDELRAAYAEVDRLARVLAAHGIEDRAVDALADLEAEDAAEARAEVVATFGARHWRAAPFASAPERD